MGNFKIEIENLKTNQLEMLKMKPVFFFFHRMVASLQDDP